MNSTGCQNQVCLDAHVFTEVLRNESIAKRVLERFLGFPICNINYIEKEELLAAGIENESICLHVVDPNGKVYDVELCMFDDEERLNWRLRAYGSSIDMYNLTQGKGIDEFNDSFIIFICRFPLLSGRKHKYVLTSTCIEDNTIKLNDGIMKVIFSTKGCIDDVSEELCNILKYLDGKEVKDKLIEEIDILVKTKLKTNTRE